MLNKLKILWRRYVSERYKIKNPLFPCNGTGVINSLPESPQNTPSNTPFSALRSFNIASFLHTSSIVPNNIKGNDAVTKEERADNERTLSGHETPPLATAEVQRSALPTSGEAVAAAVFTTRGNGTAPCRESHGRTAPHSAGNSGSTPRNDCSCRSSGACRHRWRYSAAGTLWHTNRNPRRHP